MSDYYLNLTTAAGALIALPFLYVVYEFGPLFLGQFTSPLRHLPGPPSDHWLYGNAQAIIKAENSTCQEAWMEQYGPTLAYKGFFGVRPSPSLALMKAYPRSIRTTVSSLWTPEPSAIFSLTQTITRSRRRAASTWRVPWGLVFS